ncbi:glycerol-3-phosphate dehydrogenase subunit GlpB [Arcanobacterium phocisimile]|uniref:Glycerol-3-phosphate dehydrogenase subunit GlpB n=1 Tax=Arcanobacterium phocisimile TaxID=1302235 RepID=A0ABX7II64_9ACTO|nr:glycerol-3-phosphate dehydrogenase subunit GlpB [Arcanobacterium phocisimile]QRV02430.1 glycerol-3-phosphate dehydrogenase subunit GlpB [Arcanobacterium phocisimile]
MKVVVIGAGLAGLSSALMLAEAGHRVEIISKGLGGLLLSTGGIDVYGWTAEGAPVTKPFEAIGAIDHPDHPYHKIGAQAVRHAVGWLGQRLPFIQLPADEESNSLVPTAVGAVRPMFGLHSTLLPLEDGQKLVVVGIKQFKDFPAQLIADNLSRSPLVNVSARAISIDLDVRGNEADSAATNFARFLDTTSGRAAFLDALRGQAQPDEILVLPAILGLQPETYQYLTDELGVRISEVPVPPPSVPGRRLNDALVAATKASRIDISTNAQVIGFEHEDGAVRTVHIQRAGRVTVSRVDAVIHAGGGFESGSLTRDPDGTITERIFGLPVREAADIFSSGIRVDQHMHPLDTEGNVLYRNMYLAGSILGGAHAPVEKSGEGIALGSAWVAAHSAISEGENR